MEIAIQAIKSLTDLGLWGFLVLLPTALSLPVLAYFVLRWKFGYNRVTRIMREVRRRIEVIKKSVHSAYAFELKEFVEMNDTGSSESDITQRINVYEFLLDSAFLPMEWELRRMFSENHLPKPNTNAFGKLLDDRFEYVWIITWDRFDKGYSSYFLIPHISRKEQQQAQKSEFKREFRELLVMWHDIKR